MVKVPYICKLDNMPDMMLDFKYGMAKPKHGPVHLGFMGFGQS
jgi:hypothetical protein